MAASATTVTGSGASRPTVTRKGGFFAACFLLGMLVFGTLPLSVRLPVGSPLLVQAGLAAILLVSALVSKRSESGKDYWPVLYAFFVAGAAMLLSALFGRTLLELLPLETASPAWIAVARLSESLWRVGPILLFMTIAGADLRSMYLTKGRLGRGLAVGLAGFGGLAGLSLIVLAHKGGVPRTLLSLSPWLLTFVLANGFTEELLFRGLFLKRYEPFLGKGLSNVLAALVYTALDVQVSHLGDLTALILIVFPLALACGWLMQKTESLWGSALLHAGGDCLLIFGVYAGA